MFERETTYNTVTIHNRTNVDIPQNILNLLSLGKNRGIGFPFKDNNCILEVDKLFNCFQKVAREQNMSELTLARMKSHATLCGLDIYDCTTNDPDVLELKRFLKANDQIILLEVDKSPDLIFLNKTDYHQKLNDFIGNNFEKIEIYDHKTLDEDLENYRLLINNTFRYSLPKHIIKSLFPPSSISDFYGTIKIHKNGEPIRGICTGYNSIVTNSENFLKDFLKPLVDECTYAINNQLDFKTKFLEDRVKFNPLLHRVISVDVVSMYPNVNVPRTISYVLNKIYSDPQKYFPFKNKNNIPLTPPPRELLKKFYLTLFKITLFLNPLLERSNKKVGSVWLALYLLV